MFRPSTRRASGGRADVGQPRKAGPPRPDRRVRVFPPDVPDVVAGAGVRSRHPPRAPGRPRGHQGRVADLCPVLSRRRAPSRRERAGPGAPIRSRLDGLRHVSYTVAFLNPWRDSSENQAYHSLRVAAARLRCTLVACANSMDIEACDPDYVLAVASTQPKLTRHPTFGVIHEPRERFLLNAEYLNNLLTYDGYFTIMDTLRAFLMDVLAGVGRDCEIGAYFDAPQRLDLEAPVAALAASGAIK